MDRLLDFIIADWLKKGITDIRDFEIRDLQTGRAGMREVDIVIMVRQLVETYLGRLLMVV